MIDIVEKTRHEWGESDRKRDANFKTPDDIERFDDISYGDHPEWNLLDVYRPKSEEGKRLPVIMIVHGGGWLYGDKGVYQYYAMSLAQQGFAVVNPSYRLSPEFKYPTQIEDICAVSRWIFENEGKYGFDTENLFAVGDSAGAHLTVVLSNLLVNPEFLEKMKKEYPQMSFEMPGHMRFNAVALNCGKYDILVGNFIVDGWLQKKILAKGGTRAERKLTAAADYVTGAFPPVFVMTAVGDELKKNSQIIVDALFKNGVPFCYRLYGTNDNPLHHVFHCNIALEEAKKCNRDECSFFRERIVNRHC
ncbi:MAG: alpha/beta hydrolase [Lachnospiraceae bacterium]|nr:alpha/beta hydrolase [Lachnospiraceae bacterium]